MASQTVDILVKARDHASATFGKVGIAAKIMSGALTSVAVVGAAAAAAGLLIAGKTALDSVKAYMESEKAVNGLEAALDILGKKSESASMQAFAESIQNVTTADDEAVIGMMKLGASIGNMSGDTLKRATVAAMGLSKAYGMDLESAMTLVSKAAVGNTAAMGRYGIVFKDGATDAEKFNQVIEMGATKFKMAEAETATFSGRLTQIGNLWENLKERLGQYLTSFPILQTALDYAATALSNFSLTMDIVWTKAKLSLVSFWESFKYVFTVNISEVIVWFAENWKSLLYDLWSNWIVYLGNLKDIFTELVLSIMNIWKAGFAAMWEFIKNPMGGIDLSGWFTAIKDGFMNVGKELNIFEGMDFKTPAIKFSERTKSELENSLEADLGVKVSQFMAAKNQTNALDMSKLGTAQVAANAGVAKEQKVGAVEARFLSGQAGTAYDYNKAIASENKRQTGLLERLVKATESSGKGDAVSNFWKESSFQLI